MKAKRTDVRGRLVDDPFDYRETKAGGVMISRGGRVVLTLGGARAAALLKSVEKLDGLQLQLTLAKVTGQYKQGNGR